MSTATQNSSDSLAASPLVPTASYVSNQPYPFAPSQLPAEFGRYTLKRVLGLGGMATVYLAYDSVLQRNVALKIPNGEVDKALLGRLLDEARAAANISHPAVCSFYDIGRVGKHACLTMEYIPGTTLDQMVGPKRPMSPERAVRLVLKIAAGLQAAHHRGIIHRDLKPSNILMRKGLEPVITDFGLAHRECAISLRQRAGKILGSPSYMSPEQVRGEVLQVGPATDVYGLGAILYELITGRPPFSGNVPAIYMKVLKQTPAAPSTVDARIDQNLDDICLRALSKSSGERFADVKAFATALRRYLRQSMASDVTRPPASQRDALVLMQPRAKTLAEASYSLESRWVHQPQPRGRFLMNRVRQRVRRWRRNTVPKVAVIAFSLAVTGLAVVSIAGMGSWMPTLFAQAKVMEERVDETLEPNAPTKRGNSTVHRRSLFRGRGQEPRYPAGKNRLPAIAKRNDRGQIAVGRDRFHDVWSQLSVSTMASEPTSEKLDSVRF